MDSARVAMLRELLDGTEWVDDTRRFARSLRRSTTTPGGLLLVGTPEEEPWHFAAHLDDEARYAGVPEIAPTLVRWSPPVDAPPHLAIGLERLEVARRGESLLVVAPDAAPDQLLERVDDARRIGATIFTLDTGDKELEGLAHEQLIVPKSGIVVPDVTDVKTLTGLRTRPSDLVKALDTPEMSFDTVEHLVSLAVGEKAETSASRRLSIRDRLARTIERISGPDSDAY